LVLVFNFFLKLTISRRARTQRRALRSAQGGEGGPIPRSPINFYLKLTIFLACAGTPPSPLGARGGAQARENVNLKKKLKGKTSQETTAQEQ
jgi:hypothetical protein